MQPRNWGGVMCCILLPIGGLTAKDIHASTTMNTLRADEELMRSTAVVHVPLEHIKGEAATCMA